MEYETKLKKWGNSIGVVIPKEKIKREKLKEDQKVRVMISPVKSVKVKDIYGKLKWKKSTRKIVKDLDKELDIEF